MIKKIQLVCLLGMTLLNAENLTIKVDSGELQFTINGDSMKAKQGFRKRVECNQPIEVLDGNGTLSILEDNHAIKSLCKGDEAFVFPPHKCQNLFSKVKDDIFKGIKTFIYTNETISSGSSKGAGDTTAIVQNITIPASEENIMLYSKKWGALNLRLEIIRDGKIIKTMKFEDKRADYTYFVLPIKGLQAGDKYKIISNVGNAEYLGGEKVGVSGVIVVE